MVTYICSNCGKIIERKFSRKDLNYKNHFCCKKCEAKYRKNKPKENKKQNEIIIKKDYAIIKVENNLFGKFDCLIDIEDIEKINQMECEKVGLQRNNKTGHVGISISKNNSFQVHYKNKYLGTAKDLDTAIKIREDYISSL